jgi:hypothetical protein
VTGLQIQEACTSEFPYVRISRRGRDIAAILDFRLQPSNCNINPQFDNHAIILDMAYRVDFLEHLWARHHDNTMWLETTHLGSRGGNRKIDFAGISEGNAYNRYAKHGSRDFRNKLTH